MSHCSPVEISLARGAYRPRDLRRPLLMMLLCHRFLLFFLPFVKRNSLKWRFSLAPRLCHFWSSFFCSFCVHRLKASFFCFNHSSCCSHLVKHHKQRFLLIIQQPSVAYLNKRPEILYPLRTQNTAMLSRLTTKEIFLCLFKVLLNYFSVYDRCGEYVLSRRHFTNYYRRLK